MTVNPFHRACFDYFLLENSLFVPDNDGGSMEFYLARVPRAPKNDPLPLVPSIAQATTHFGIVPTISTSYYPPFLLARLIATLDPMSKAYEHRHFRDNLWPSEA